MFEHLTHVHGRWHGIEYKKIWGGWRDSNPHVFRRLILNQLRLPVPPHPRYWLVGDTGVEPVTPGLKVRCSNQLS